MLNTKTSIMLVVMLALALVQGDFAQTPSSGLAAQRAAAERAWPIFFQSFRAAVNKRDRAKLKEMMARAFFFSGGGGPDNHNHHMRDYPPKSMADPQPKPPPPFINFLASAPI